MVEAVFDLKERPGLAESLAERGIECDGELLVKRVVARSGKNRVFINGGLSTLAILAEISRELVNIYGQHESQTLLKPENHLALLDGFAGFVPLRESFSALYADYRDVAAAIRKLEEGEREAARRIDLLSFQVNEIAETGLSPGEDAELEAERRLLANADRLLTGSRSAYDLLYDGESSVTGLLGRAVRQVRDLLPADDSLAPLAESLDSCAIQLEDAAFTLRDYASNMEADPQRLEAVDERLELIRRLKKKYAPTIEEILAFGDEADRELATLTNSEQAKGELQAKLTSLRKEMERAGSELSKARHDASARMKEAMEAEIRGLAMPHARFDIQLEPLAEPKSSGMERAEFLFSPNPGESAKPLSKIASGGELSRLMLALKQIHPESDVPTLVFDEVDTGIGGAVSALVGEKLRRVAAGQQVLCITHLPQVAAFAHRQYRVEKRVEDGRTATSVVMLEGEERVREMARMLGGTKITDTTLEHAREMIAHGKESNGSQGADQRR